jgi:hypothetical protein
MTLDERYGRLVQSGKLPSIGDVAKRFATPSPSREQIVQHGEEEEERQRQAAIAQSRSSQIGQAAWGVGKKTLAAALSVGTAATNPISLLTLPATLYALEKSLQAFGKSVSESNRDLRQFNSRISDSFARLDYAQMRSRHQLATSTSGSSSFLNNSFTALVREMQPMRESMATLVNSTGILAIQLARAINTLLTPMAASLKTIAEIAEWWYGKSEMEEPQAAARDFLRSIRDGKFSMPASKKPGER